MVLCLSLQELVGFSPWPLCAHLTVLAGDVQWAHIGLVESEENPGIQDIRDGGMVGNFLNIVGMIREVRHFSYLFLIFRRWSLNHLFRLVFGLQESRNFLMILHAHSFLVGRDEGFDILIICIFLIFILAAVFLWYYSLVVLVIWLTWYQGDKEYSTFSSRIPYFWDNSRCISCRG